MNFVCKTSHIQHVICLHKRKEDVTNLGGSWQTMFRSLYQNRLLHLHPRRYALQERQKREDVAETY